MAAGGGGGGGGGGGEDVVELKVSSSTSEDILVVHVSRSCTLREIKATIGQELRRPELVEVAKFVRILPNGETVPIHDGQQLGSRKALCLDGAPLVPAPPERDAATLEDFDENDRSWSITSPRSLRACASEGILPEELFHTPLDEYDDVEPSPILAQLQHDFFDAYRSDLLRIARKARAALIAEDGGQSNTESSTWSVVGPGGQWSGPLSAQSGHEEYASTYAFLSGQRKLVTLDIWITIC